MTLWTLPPEDAQKPVIWFRVLSKRREALRQDFGVLIGACRDEPKAGSHRGRPGSPAPVRSGQAKSDNKAGVGSDFPELIDTLGDLFF